MTAEEIHQLGLSEVARILGEMDKVRQQVGFKGDLQAFFNFLETDPQFYFTNGADLLQGYRDLKLRIDAALPKLFSVFPKADYEVRPVEAFRAQSAAGGVVPAAVGGRLAARHFLRQHLQPEGAAEVRHGDAVAARGVARATTSRCSIQQELEDVPRFRRFGGDYTAYVEGWALYAEYLGKELGLFTDPTSGSAA